MWTLLAALLTPGSAHATAPGPYPVRLNLGVSGVAAPPSTGGMLASRVLLMGRRLGAAEIGAREGWVSNDARMVGALFFGVRWMPDLPLHVRGGFAHHHEIPQDVLVDNPVRAIAGSSEGIRHRSGAELGVGTRLPLQDRVLGDRLGVELDLSLSWLPDPQGPAIYGFVDGTFTVDLGRARSDTRTPPPERPLLPPE